MAGRGRRARADDPAARFLRRDLHRSRRPPRSHHPLSVGSRRRLHHDLPGPQDRAGAGGAAGPLEPARPGHPGRRSAADCGPGGRARRPGRGLRGRPRSRRRKRPLGVEPERRRIAVDGRIRSGLQARGPGGRSGDRAAGGTSVFRHARGRGPGPRARDGDRTGHRDGQDRQVSRDDRDGGDAAPAPDGPDRGAASGARGRALPSRGLPLRAVAGESLRRAPRRSGARDVDPAGGVSRRADDLPRARSLAALAQTGSDAPGRRDRGARRRDRALCRQDRHPDAQPDESDPPRQRRTEPGRGRRRNASRRVSRARGIRGPGEPDVALRSDGAGDSRARPAHTRPNRAPARGLGSSARVSPLTRKARRDARLEGSRAGGGRDRGQGGAGSDRGPVSPRGPGDRAALRVRRGAGGGGVAGSRGGPGPFSQRGPARGCPRLPLRIHGPAGPRGSSAGVGARSHPRLQDRGNPGRHDHGRLPGHRREDREGDRAAGRGRDDGRGARRAR